MPETNPAMALSLLPLVESQKVMRKWVESMRVMGPVMPQLSLARFWLLVVATTAEPKVMALLDTEAAMAVIWLAEVESR